VTRAAKTTGGLAGVASVAALAAWAVAAATASSDTCGAVSSGENATSALLVVSAVAIAAAVPTALVTAIVQRRTPSSVVVGMSTLVVCFVAAVVDSIALFSSGELCF
jgi:hypothetical protein